VVGKAGNAQLAASLYGEIHHGKIKNTILACSATPTLFSTEATSYTIRLLYDLYAAKYNHYLSVRQSLIEVFYVKTRVDKEHKRKCWQSASSPHSLHPDRRTAMM
jgi:hypothetical protein